MTAKDDFRKQYEEAIEDAFEKGKKTIDEAVKRAEARRRFQADSQGRTTITYVDPVEEELTDS